MTIGFEGQVAIVTGAGGGLGRAYALELGRRGAKVVVNDVSADRAAAVTARIVAAGGVASADGRSVTDDAAMRALAQETLAAWGRIDVLIANAGAVRDKTFANLDASDFATVMDVNLTGAINLAKSAWPAMVAQSYGRIVLTTSAAGLYGNFGQANYGAAKLGVVGLMNTLRLEGARRGIHVNCIAPGALTPMTDNIVPEPLRPLMSVDRVVPAVVFLSSEASPNGAIVSACAGRFAAVHIVETEGIVLDESATAEDVQSQWARIVDATGARAYDSVAEQSRDSFERVQRKA